MSSILPNTDLREGLLKDPISGDFRFQPGYEYEANRFKIDETWLDEEDHVWVSAAAVDRLAGDSYSQPEVLDRNS